MIRLLVLFCMCGAMLTACSSSMTKKDRAVAGDRAPMSSEKMPAWMVPSGEKKRQLKNWLLTQSDLLQPVIQQVLEKALDVKARTTYDRTGDRFASLDMGVKFKNKPYALAGLSSNKQNPYTWPLRVRMDFDIVRRTVVEARAHCTAYYVLDNINFPDVLDNIGKVKRGEKSLAFEMTFEIDSCSSSKYLPQTAQGRLRISKTFQNNGKTTTLSPAISDRLLGQVKVVLSGRARISLTMPKAVSVRGSIDVGTIEGKYAGKKHRQNWELQFEHQLEKDYKLNAVLYSAAQ